MNSPTPRELRRMERTARRRLQLVCAPCPMYRGKDMRRAGGERGREARAMIFRGLMVLALWDFKNGGGA